MAGVMVIIIVVYVGHKAADFTILESDEATHFHSEMPVKKIPFRWFLSIVTTHYVPHNEQFR